MHRRTEPGYMLLRAISNWREVRTATKLTMQLNNRAICNRRGFTLIELLLYLGLAAVMMLTLAVFFSTMISARVKNQAIAEVEEQGAQILDIITQEVRNADAINSPAAGGSATSLSLDTVLAWSDPTVFDITSGVIRMKQGNGTTTALTNGRVTASGLTFQNLSRSATTGAIRITFTLSHVNPAGRNEFEYSKTFYGSASLR